MQSEVGEATESRTRGKGRWVVGGLVGVLGVAGLVWGLNLGGADPSGSDASKGESTRSSQSDPGADTDNADGALQQASDNPGPRVSNVPVGKGEDVPADEAVSLEAAADETEATLAKADVADVESSIEEFEAREADSLSSDEESELDDAVDEFLDESSVPEDAADAEAGSDDLGKDTADSLRADADGQVDTLQELTDTVTAEAKP